MSYRSLPKFDPSATFLATARLPVFNGVSFKPGEFPSKDIPVEIPKLLLDGLPPELFDPPKPHPYKAEIQVRTILEHAWADISHDMTYKSGFKVPARILREFAAAAMPHDDSIAMLNRRRANSALNCYRFITHEFTVTLDR